MGRATLDRRGLLRGTAAASIALSVPVVLATRGFARNTDALTAYLRIAQDGAITLVTPVSEIGPYRFQPGNMTKVLMEDYMAEVQPKSKAA